jgi:hypothetical protein
VGTAQDCVELHLLEERVRSRLGVGIHGVHAQVMPTTVRVEPLPGAAPKPLLAHVMTTVLAVAGIVYSPTCAICYRTVQISMALRQGLKYHMVTK